MLFSHAGTAAFLGDRFEPAWTGLRPVPTVTVDFGDGRSVRRTLHGNVLTFVCEADGTVVDALPGLYDAPSYRSALEEILELRRSIRDLDPRARVRSLAERHRLAARPAGVRDALLDLSKTAIERPVKMALSRAMAPGVDGTEAPSSGPPEAVPSPSADALANEADRRPAVHGILAEAGPVRPAAIVRRIYREVLHCDLDDPALGLGKVGDDRK